jgi:CHAT domain-containing protein
MSTVVNGERRYLIEHTVNGQPIEIGYSPNVALLRACLKRQQEQVKRNLFVVNPEGNLRFTEPEFEVIQRLHDMEEVVSLEQKQATPSAVIEESQTCHLLDVACHATFAPYPLAAELRLSGESLTLADVFVHLRLSKCLVTILEACETGLVDWEDYIGFPSGFLSVGARSVVATLWKVPDLPTALLITRFHENVSTHRLGIAQALNEAQRWLRTLTFPDLQQNPLYEPFIANKLFVADFEQWTQHAQGKPPFAHPYRWAAFISVGGWQ